MTVKYDSLEATVRAISKDEKPEFLNQLSVLELSTLATRLRIDTASLLDKFYDALAEELKGEIIKRSESTR